jgi:hypothetical protein
MKALLFLLLLIFLSISDYAQKKLLVEKIGTNRKYYFLEGDKLKLKIKPFDTVTRGKLLDIQDAGLTLSGLTEQNVMIKNIGSVYKKYAFPRKFAIYSSLFGGAIFAIIVTNHLINNEQVFTPDLFIISGAFLGAGLVSFSFSQKQCKIGSRWKVKVLDFSLVR